MLRLLSLTAILSTVLSTAFVAFLPQVASAIPSGTIINESFTRIEPINNCRRVLVDPIYNTRTIIVEPNCYRTIATPINTPINNFGTVIINPTHVSPTFNQPRCGAMIFGIPIPSPVPVNPYTGLRC